MMLILLDIDGVMVPANSWKKPELHADGFPMFKPKAITALQKIVAETNASILLTTSHKYRYNIQQWFEIFKSRGIYLNMINRLENNTSNLNRKDEILAWYLSNDHENESFVIIDDDKSLNELPPNLKNKLVLTSSSVGLTDELANDAIFILNHTSFTFA